jgi:hypothetical protein
MQLDKLSDTIDEVLAKTGTRKLTASQRIVILGCVGGFIPGQPAGVSDEVRKLIGRIDQFRMCMSYNDSYFGEPAGLLKGVFAELARAVNPIYPSGKTALYPDLVPADRIMIHESEGEGASFAAFLAALAAVKP